MDLFEKFSNVAQNVGEEAANAVKSVGDYIKTTNGDQRDMAGLKVQLDMINKKLETYYAAIGKRYVDYVNAPASADAFNVDDIITQMEPLLSLKAETELKISEKEQAWKLPEGLRTQRLQRLSQWLRRSLTERRKSLKELLQWILSPLMSIMRSSLLLRKNSITMRSSRDMRCSSLCRS